MTDIKDTAELGGSAGTPQGADMHFDHWSSKMAYSPYDVWGPDA